MSILENFHFHLDMPISGTIFQFSSD